MRRGYARLIHDEQDLADQAHQLRAAGCSEVLLERDGGAPGRIRLDEYLYDLKPGEEVVTLSLGMFGRSTGKLVALLDQLVAKGVAARVLQPRPLAIDPATPGRDLELLALLADHERERMRERYGNRGGSGRGGRKRTLTHAEATAALTRYHEGESLAAIARALGAEPKAVAQALSGRRRVGETLYRAQEPAPRMRATALFPRPGFQIVREPDGDDE